MAEKQRPSTSRNVQILDEEARFQRKVQHICRLFADNHIDDPDGLRKKSRRKNSRKIYHGFSSSDSETSEGEIKGKQKGRGRGRGRGKAEKKRSGMAMRNWTITIDEYIELHPEEFPDGSDDDLNYKTARVPPSKYPEKHYCNVCGFRAPYTCVQCGIRFCSVKCLKIHRDTRCLKWVV